ncbi:MAG TPA: chitobiase/beta-hexosaminidase C-terminal domain-containing protein [Candidatus Acidoferrum sp.]
MSFSASKIFSVTVLSSSAQDTSHANRTPLHAGKLFLRRLVLALVFSNLISLPSFAQTNVTTQHYDISRSGANTNETILTPANVNTATFGKLFSQPVDGYVYAQPLYMPNITLGTGTAQAGTKHNIVFVATEHDSVFAYDADSNIGANAAPLWQVSLIDTAHGAGAGETTVPNGDVSTTDILPEIGITSTPVIDPSSNTLYVVAKSTVAGTTFIQRLHALDITTGAEKFAGPAALAASVPGIGNGSSNGILNFDPKWESNRPGLLLLNGIVYLAFGAHGDNGPWHGWLLAYHASALQLTGAWCATPNASAGGIWMGGTGIAADVPTGKPFGRIFTATGNGTFDAIAPNYTNSMDYADSIIKLDLNNGVPTMSANGVTVGDDFTPHDQASMNNGDLDQAAGGVVILPDSVGGGGSNHQLVQVGKTARVFVLNRENLGGYNPNNTTDPEESAYLAGGLWGGPAYWNGNVYIWGTNDHLKAFSFANGALNGTPTSTSNETAGQFSPTPSVSANGTTNGIVWSLRTDNYGTQGREILYAHNATNVSTLLYSSESNVARDNPGNSVKFITPTVTNGKVYVGSESQLSVFGLLNGSMQAAAPIFNPPSGSFSTSVQVTLTDSTSGASIYYTTDGSTPTTSSTRYTVPFTLTTSTTVNAIAAGTGILASTVSSATYTLLTQAAIPTFNPTPGSYTSVQSVTISTSTPNATIFYTTDGSTPTTSSSKYSGPISIAVTETLSAIAVATGLTNSPVASGFYTISLGVTSINFASGFSSGGMNLISAAKLNRSALELTDGNGSEASAAWYQSEANIQSFTTDFTFQNSGGTNPQGDGFTFAIQGNNSSAVGPVGGGLGYGPDNITNPSTASNSPILNSIAIKFDLYSNAGEGTDSTGLYTNGASPTIPALDMTSSGVNLHATDIFHAHITYDGTTLNLTLTDTVTNAHFSASWPVNIPQIVGDTVSYIGFTAGTGGATAVQQILTWTFTSSNNAPPQTPTPTFNPPAGTYLGAQSVTISDSTTPSTIYFTTNGSTPTTSSTQYTSPISVTASETINALAIASGQTASSVATAAYTIESQVATPTFSPAAGTYTSTQTVSITSSSGASIYYTTNGTTPTTSSTPYTVPFTVSSTTTVQAIAAKSGFFNSNVATATYTINSTSPSINLSAGFTAGAMILNGNATLNGTRLRLTDGNGSEDSSAWFITPVNIQQFTTSFTFQNTGGTNPQGDGFTFTIQGNSSTTIGPRGGGLGYGPDNVINPSTSPNPPVAKSIAIKFDLYSNAGEGPDSTGLYINGASPTIPAVDMTSSGVNIHNPDIFNVQLTYNGTNLTMTITDTTTNATFTDTWPINIPSTVGSNTAYAGFTAGTGGATAIQEIIGWTYTP